MDTPTLFDVIDNEVAWLTGKVFKRRRRATKEEEFEGKPNRPHLKYKAQVYFTRMENDWEMFGAKAELAGANLSETLAAFTGHAFTPQEIAGLEIKQ